MSNPEPPADRSCPPSRAFPWVVLLALLAFTAGIGDGDLRVDNLRYAAISKQLLHSDNPLLLYLGNEPFLNKPPLLFWLTAATMRVLGATVYAAKLVSALFGVGLVVLVFFACRRMFGNDRIGCFSAIVLVTTPTILRETHGCRMESMLTVFLVAALLLFMAYRQDQRFRWMAGWGVANGLAVLTKGVAGFAAALACVIYLLWFDRRNRRAWRHFAAGCLVMALTCGWWYAYVGRTTDFYDVYVKKQVIERMTGGPDRSAAEGETPGLDTTTSERFKPDPWHRFLTHVLEQYFHYLPFCVVGVAALWRERRSDPILRLFALFVVLYVAGLHLLETKYSRYLYQVFAVLSIPTAAGAARWIKVPADRLVAALAIAAACFLALCPIPLHRTYYSPLADINRLARNADLTVVFGPELYRRLDGRSAAWFFFDAHQTEPPVEGPYLYVNRASPPPAPARLVLATKRLQVHLVEGAETAPARE